MLGENESVESDAQNTTETATEIKTEIKTETEQSYDNLPKLEDLLKSEHDVKTAPELKGLTTVENETVSETRTFTRKVDEKKKLVKKRLKVITGVYVSVLALLLVFVGFNIFTLVTLNKDINSNANTIQHEEYWLEANQHDIPIDSPDINYGITLNQPRDYDDDTRGLSFMDKLIILFKNLFG